MKSFEFTKVNRPGTTLIIGGVILLLIAYLYLLTSLLAVFFILFGLYLIYKGIKNIKIKQLYKKIEFNGTVRLTELNNNQIIVISVISVKFDHLLGYAIFEGETEDGKIIVVHLVDKLFAFKHKREIIDELKSRAVK